MVKNSQFSYFVNLQGIQFSSTDLKFRAYPFAKADLKYTDSEVAELTQANFDDSLLEDVLATNALFNGEIIDGANFTNVLLSPKYFIRF